MRWDLNKNIYKTDKEYKEYIYGSADVVGLMCLKVFVKGNDDLYLKLKPAAMSLDLLSKSKFFKRFKKDYQELEELIFQTLILIILMKKLKPILLKKLKMILIWL